MEFFYLTLCSHHFRVHQVNSLGEERYGHFRAWRQIITFERVGGDPEIQCLAIRALESLKPPADASTAAGYTSSS